MEWRTCLRHPNYEVSECGDVRRLYDSPTRPKGHRYKGYIDLDGYLSYALYDERGVKQPVQAHTLVAEAFHGPKPSPKHEVAHENGSRVMNHFSNLRWSTRKDNHADMQHHGTALKGMKNGRATLTDGEVREIRRQAANIQAGIGEISWKDLSAEYALTVGHLKLIAKRKAWGHIE